MADHADQNISDLAVSPADHSIMASASEDCSIRLWSLDQAHQEQPTAGIAFGEGHKESILALVRLHPIPFGLLTHSS
jgi:polycomb protein EED